MKLLLKGGLVPRQLNLFSAEELAKCQQITQAINRVRNSLYMPIDFRSRIYPKFKTNGKVIKFPKKFVS